MHERSPTSNRWAQWTRWLTVVLAFMLFPGAPEAFTDLGHAIVADTDHAPPCEQDTHDTDEHGCSGLFHVCRCCPTVLALETRIVALWTERLPTAGEREWTAPRDVLLDAHTEPPFRPPAA